MDSISSLSKKYFEKMVSIRRHLHQYPELSGQEELTARFICEQLDLLGIPYQSNFSGHGVVALLQGDLEGDRCVALRADMDALPIQEESQHEYRSKHPGVMHACGHDFHTASLLGTLMIMNYKKNKFGGVIKAIFQPSEEEYNGGANFMIADGVLENPKVDYIFGLHADTGFGPETVGFRPGKYMASADELHFTIVGKGGHAALIHETVNPIYIGARLLLRWEEYFKELRDQEEPFVLNFGKFTAGNTNNVVPEKAFMSGILRLFDEGKRERALKEIEQIAHEVCEQHGAQCEVDIRRGYPSLYNDPDVTARAIQLAEQHLGKEHVLPLGLRSTSEDFSYYLQEIPGLFFRVGVAKPNREEVYPAHSSRFDIDEKALLTASQMFSLLALDFLK